MTQLAPQHVIFLLPWLAYIFYKLCSFSIIGRALNIIFLFGSLYAGFLHQTMDFVDWEKIQVSLKSNNTTIITDAPGSLEIFLDNKDILWFGYEELVNANISQNDTIAIILTNWKFYQEIVPLQFWHNPKGSQFEYNKLSELFLSINNSGFRLLDGYSFFPIHAYTFVRDTLAVQEFPWLFDIKYRGVYHNTDENRNN